MTNDEKTMNELIALAQAMATNIEKDASLHARTHAASTIRTLCVALKVAVDHSVRLEAQCAQTMQVARDAIAVGDRALDKNLQLGQQCDDALDLARKAAKLADDVLPGPKVTGKGKLS